MIVHMQEIYRYSDKEMQCMCENKYKFISLGENVKPLCCNSLFYEIYKPTP